MRLICQAHALIFTPCLVSVSVKVLPKELFQFLFDFSIYEELLLLLLLFSTSIHASAMKNRLA